jgi:CheY-like chemotaxis protein
MVGPRRILVVDDNPDMRTTLVELLASLGMETATANDGRAALALFAKGCPFDVVIADVVMPDIGGIKLAETLRERFPDVPVIIMTGRDSQVEGSIEAGVVPLMKPFSALQLKRVIDDAIDSRAD